MLKVQDIQVVLAGKPVLEVMEFELHKGEICAILGPNGAGKTTFLNVILGNQKVFRGNVFLRGKSLSEYTVAELAQHRRRTGYVPQLKIDVGPFPITVEEALYTGLSAAKGLLCAISAIDQEKAQYWLKKLQIDHLKKHRVNEISGGELRKLMIARAMAQDPDLLLLDEYTANLDTASRDSIVQSLQQIQQEQGITCVIAAHDLESIPKNCDKILRLIPPSPL